MNKINSNSDVKSEETPVPEDYVNDELKDDTTQTETTQDILTDEHPETKEDTVPEEEKTEQDTSNIDTSNIDTSQNDDTDTQQQFETVSDKLLQQVNEHFDFIYEKLKYLITRNQTISELSHELQKYRDDFCIKAIQPSLKLLAIYREDCRKTKREIDKYQYSKDVIIKQINSMFESFISTLADIGLEFHGDTWLYNGRPLDDSEKVPAFSDFHSVEKSDVEFVPISDQITSAEKFMEYLTIHENYIAEKIADTDAIYDCLSENLKLESYIEKDITRIYMLPFLRTLVRIRKTAEFYMNDAISKINDINCVDIFKETTEFFIAATEPALAVGGVTIKSGYEDYKGDIHRLVNVIPTDDKTLDRKVGFEYTECYFCNGKVIYQSKVDVYKYTTNNK